jgi:APA family basic amino acid/polyamine antiporter
VHPHNQTPGNAIIIQAVWTTLLIALFYAWKDNPKAAFDGLTDSVVCAGMIFYGMTVASVYVLRLKRPELDRPYRTWGYPVTPALLILAYAFTFVGQLLETWQQTAGVLGLIAAGIVYYYTVRWIISWRRVAE